MPAPKLVAARTFFSRMNEGRSTWLSESELVAACEAFFIKSGFSKIEKDKRFEGIQSSFESPIVGIREPESGEQTGIVTIVKPKIEKYEISLQSSIESALYDILDNYDNFDLALATDSMSYWSITRNSELNVAIENLMDEGLRLLLLNGKAGYVLFDQFSELTAPIAILD